MSEINHASVYYPPSFPELGRLPRHAQQVHRNLRQQDQKGAITMMPSASQQGAG